jgi:hypothetical protein
MSPDEAKTCESPEDPCVSKPGPPGSRWRRGRVEGARHKQEQAERV